MATTCCIAGGGPAGMMLALLLSRLGIDVTVLERHGDFFRDFRGDTLHPSTLEVMHELGLLDGLLALPHQEARQMKAAIDDQEFIAGDFSHLSTRCKFIAFMPQWDFLAYLSQCASRHPSFRLLMNHRVETLLREGGRVAGVRATHPGGTLEVRADLVVACDGRHSTVREQAQLPAIDLGAPIDVLWMRISRLPDEGEAAFGNSRMGHVFIALNRGDYFQCGMVIPKGALAEIQAAGLERFQRSIAEAMPLLKDRVGEIDAWDKVKLLTVQVNRLERWHLPGLLCIGDAAHAMSPVGGVGINLAIQDAVAAANILAEPLRCREVDSRVLEKIQRRRMFPTRATQWLQIQAQKGVFQRLDPGRPRRLPLVARLLRRFPILRRIPGRLVGMGFRPEHVQGHK